MAAADPATGPPTTMDIYYYLPDVAAAWDQLLALAEEYEFDREPVERWYQDAQAGRRGRRRYALLGCPARSAIYACRCGATMRHRWMRSIPVKWWSTTP